MGLKLEITEETEKDITFIIYDTDEIHEKIDIDSVVISLVEADIIKFIQYGEQQTGIIDMSNIESIDKSSIKGLERIKMYFGLHNKSLELINLTGTVEGFIRENMPELLESLESTAKDGNKS